jgi:hypothetical protein
MTHLNTYNISYGRKKARESKCQFDSRPLKVNNYFDLHACRWFSTYHWKTIDKGYDLALDLTSFKGLNMKLWASKVLGIPISRISGFSTWEP